MSKTVKIQATNKIQPCRTCLKCGWVYFGVSREYATLEIAKFNKYVQSIPKKDWKQCWGAKFSTLRHYLFCWCGNPYYNFRASKKKDCPDGCTINPILYETEEDHNAKQAKREKQKADRDAHKRSSKVRKGASVKSNPRRGA